MWLSGRLCIEGGLNEGPRLQRKYKDEKRSKTIHSGATFVLFCFVFRLYAFVEAAALRSILLRYTGAPIATRVSFFLCYWQISLFPIFFVSFSLSLCTESTSYVLSFRLVFFYLVTTGWIFYISSCENSINRSINQLINQSINQSIKVPDSE